MFYVTYTIPDLRPGHVYRVGPYEETEARYQLWDIAGFDGVADAKLERACEEVSG